MYMQRLRSHQNLVFLCFLVPVVAVFAGQAVSEALVMDFTRHLNRILEVNEAEGWVRAEPGLVLDRLKQKPGACRVTVWS